MGAILKKVAVFLKENAFCVNHFVPLIMGTMRQKMTIFKKGNSVCRCTKFFMGMILDMISSLSSVHYVVVGENFEYKKH